MINLVILKNPFSPKNREIKQVAYIPGQPVFSYILPEMMGFDEVVISRNGKIVPEEEYQTLIPTPGDYIAVCPVISGGGDDGGKDVARALAQIAVMAFALWAGGAVAGAMYGGQWGFWSYVTAA